MEEYHAKRQTSTDMSDSDSIQSFNVTNVKTKNTAHPLPPHKINTNCLLVKGNYSDRAKQPHTSGKIGFCLERKRIVCLDCESEGAEEDLCLAARVMNDAMAEK